MNTLTLDQLGDLLLADAEGVYAGEAAAHLLIAHDRWLRRDDFLAVCVNYDHHAGDGHPVAWVDWDAVPAFVEAAPCASSEARILRLACELAGVDTGHPLEDLLAGLDDIRGGLVLDALAHAVTRGGRR